MASIVQPVLGSEGDIGHTEPALRHSTFTLIGVLCRKHTVCHELLRSLVPVGQQSMPLSRKGTGALIYSCLVLL